MGICKLGTHLVPLVELCEYDRAVLVAQELLDGGAPLGVELEAAVQGGHGVGGAVRLGLDKLLKFQLSFWYFWAKLNQPC